MTNCRNVELLLDNTPNFTYGYNTPYKSTVHSIKVFIIFFQTCQRTYLPPSTFR